MNRYDEVMRFIDPQADNLLARWPAPRRALLLDRDGVVNRDCGYVHTPAQTRWMPGIFELLGAAHAAGFLPVVVTNQAGIGRGFYDIPQFLEYTRWQHGVFAEHGTPLLATYFCPHHPQAGRGEYLRACGCRKPGADMILAAAAAFAIDLADSALVGDKASDIEAAVAAGVGASELITDDPGALPALSARLFAQGPP